MIWTQCTYLVIEAQESLGQRLSITPQPAALKELFEAPGRLADLRIAARLGSLKTKSQER